jgi:signal transduction histidine kinase
MSTDTGTPDAQTTLSMKRELLGELWNEVRRAVDILRVASGENEALKQNLAKANSEIEKLKSQIADLEKILTSRESASTKIFDEKEKNRLIEAAEDLISKIDHQLNTLSTIP